MNSNLRFSTHNKDIRDIDITFVIPTYKNKKYLDDAIDSVLKQSSLSKLKFEILVICNDPMADMSTHINRYRECQYQMRIYVNLENYGQVGNLNQAFSLAKGKYVAVLHDDDVLLPNYIDVIEKYIKSGKYDCILPSCYLIFNKYKFDFRHKLLSFLFFPRFFIRKPIQQLFPKEYIITFDNIYGPPSCGALFSKKMITEFGYFKDVHGAAWDYYNFRRLNEQFNIFLIHDYVGIRRSESGMSMNSKVREEFIKDRITLIEDELRDNKFVQKYSDVIINRRPLFKLLWWRFITKTYYYYHNLDSKKSMPYKLFKQYRYLIGDK